MTEVQNKWALVKKHKPVERSIVWVACQDEPGRWGVWQCVFRRPYYMSVNNCFPLEFIKGLDYYWTYSPVDLPGQIFELDKGGL